MSKVDHVSYPCCLRQVVMTKQDVSDRVQEWYEALWFSHLACSAHDLLVIAHDLLVMGNEWDIPIDYLYVNTRLRRFKEEVLV